VPDSWIAGSSRGIPPHLARWRLLVPTPSPIKPSRDIRDRHTGIRAYAVYTDSAVHILGLTHLTADSGAQP
jgi:hypothetical protein